jgi:hypothetical protein
MIHVAILKPGYIRDILAGSKTIESRLTKTMQPPHGKIETGERLFLKASGGAFMATAIAGTVHTFEDMGPTDVKQLRKRYGKPIGGDDAYWDMKWDSRFATLIELKEVEPLSVGPKYKVAYMKAWYVLDEKLSPLRDWVITAGALRNNYACLPKPPGAQSRTEQVVTLVLPDGSSIETELAAGRRLRWRGWAAVYQATDARAGDRLRFVAIGQRRYAVQVARG